MPGRSWKGLAEALLTLMPPMVIADLGAGEGTFSQLLAQRAKRVIAVDNSEKMVEFGRSWRVSTAIENLEYRRGDLEDVPIRTATVDLAFFSQALHHARHPERAMAEAWRIFRPGGRIVVLDLLRHKFEEARELYADVWLGFTEVELERLLGAGGFKNMETAVVYRERRRRISRRCWRPARSRARSEGVAATRSARSSAENGHGRGLPSLRPPPRAEDVGGLRLRSVGGPGRRLKAG